MLLQQLFSPSRIMIGVESSDKEELFEEMTERIVRDAPKGMPRAAVVAALNEREAKMSTGIKKGIAIPHAHVEGLPSMAASLAVIPGGFDYRSLDNEPVYLVFMVVAPPSEGEIYLQAIKNLAILLEDPEFRSRLILSRTGEEANAVIAEYEAILASSF